MEPIANTPQPPYYAVIFTSQLGSEAQGYDETARRMLELADGREGFLGAESVRDQSGCGITVSYWRDPEAIDAWYRVAEHRQAQKMGKEKWYQKYCVRVCKVERSYGSPSE